MTQAEKKQIRDVIRQLQEIAEDAYNYGENECFFAAAEKLRKIVGDKQLGKLSFKS